jgi:MazG family protein
VRRHPHVFGNVTVNGVADVTANWEAIKQEERSTRNGEHEASPSVLDGVPAALPALAQALAISKRAVRVGFEWPDIAGVLDKLIEEAHEITEAADPATLEAEIGDLLFSAVNLARWRNVDPESALRATNTRFTRRFKKLEALAAAQGKLLSEMTIAELDALWNEAKSFEQ